MNGKKLASHRKGSRKSFLLANCPQGYHVSTWTRKRSHPWAPQPWKFCRKPDSQPLASQNHTWPPCLVHFGD